LEFFGGIAIALGLGTRPVAFILSGTMAVAYWQFHAPNAVSPVQNQVWPLSFSVSFPLPERSRRRRLEYRRHVTKTLELHEPDGREVEAPSESTCRARRSSPYRANLEAG